MFMNLPNKITLSRILLIPLVIFFYLAIFIPYGRFVAAALFIIACWTDFLDGHIARKRNLVTDLGKFFDSIADKVLIMTGMILSISVPLRGIGPVAQPVMFTSVCMIIILAREFIISALRQIAASKGKVLAADKGGKIKAAIQDVTISLYMIYAAFVADTNIFVNASSNTANAVINIILLVMLTVSTLLTITSGVSYIVRNRSVFSDKKDSNNNNNKEGV